MTPVESAWHPLSATYTGERGWMVLFARYGEGGWEFAQRVVDPDTMLPGEYGETSGESNFE